MAVKRMLEADFSRNVALKLGFSGRYSRQEMESQFLERHIENLVRQPVREEVERVLQKLSPKLVMPPNLIEADEACQYELHFNCLLPDTFLTNHIIKAKNGKVQILIRDAISKETITHGNLSSKKVEIVVLDGEFDEQGNWKKEKFDKSVVLPRKDKRPLLYGRLEIKLSNGVGYLENISFTDNSSWTRSRKFRLGAAVKESSSCGPRIREAKSEAFSVKDQRLEAKYRPISLKDEVRRLKSIGEKISERLKNKGIVTVDDLMNLFNSDPKQLCSMMGSRMTIKKLEEIVQQAKNDLVECGIYQELQYSFQCGGDTAEEVHMGYSFLNHRTDYMECPLEMNSAEHLPYSGPMHVEYGEGGCLDGGGPFLAK